MQEEETYASRQLELITAVTEGNLSSVQRCFQYKGFNDNNQMGTLVLTKIFKLQDEYIEENHFLILQMVLSLMHPHLDRILITNICHWLITMKEVSKGRAQKLSLYFGPRIFTLLRQCGYIDVCVFENLHSVNEIPISQQVLVRANGLSTEMLTAILTNNVEAFEPQFNNMQMNYEIYKEILLKCLDIENKAYDIVCWLLQEQPLSVQSPNNVRDCIALLQNYLFVNNQNEVPNPQLNAAKISTLQYISLCYALAKNRGPLRSDLTTTLRKMLQSAGIVDANTKNAQQLIYKLICNINPELQREMDVLLPPQEKHSVIDLSIFACTLFYNVVRVLTDSTINRRDFIDDNIMLGMIPGCKCGLSIIDAFKKKNKTVALVVTCLKSHEVQYESVLYTPANPEFWCNQPGNIEQIFVPLKDFGFDTDPSKVCTAVNKIHEVVKQNKGGVYVHCKAGKARSVMIVALYYVLFRQDFWQGTLKNTIRFVYNYIQERRPQINNNKKSWDAVEGYVNVYLQSHFQHADIGHYLRQSVDEFVMISGDDVLLQSNVNGKNM